MKIIKSYGRLIPIIGIPIFVISALLLWFLNKEVISIFKIHWLILAAALIIVVTPYGKPRLESAPEKPTRYKLRTWLTKIILLQLSLGAIFFGITLLCGQTMPILTSTHPQLFQHSLKQLLLYEGLFPWGIIGLLASLIGYYAYCTGKDVYFHTLVSRFKISMTIGVIINYCARLSTALVYAISFTLISLFWVSQFKPLIITGFNLTPMLVILILLILSRTKCFKNQYKKTLKEKMPIMLGVYIWVIFFAVAIWFLNGLLAAFINLPMTPPAILERWLHAPWENLWWIFANAWWLLWVPLISIMIARMSRGRRIREVIGATLILPIMSLAFTLFYKGTWTISPIYAIFIVASGLLGLLITTMNKKVWPLFVLCYLPKHDHYKFRSPVPYLLKIMKLAATFLFLYLPGGLILINLFLSGLSILLLIIFLMCIAAFFTHWISDSE